MSRSRTMFALAALAAVAAAPAAAQDKGSPAPAAPFALSTDQQAKIALLLKAHGSAMQAAFKGEDKLRAALESELRAIEATKDPKSRRAAIQAFQSKNASSYRAVLARGKIDLAELAGKLNAIAPFLALKVRDGTHLVGGARQAAAAGGPAATAPAPTTTVKTLGSGDFRFSRDLGCGAIAGSSATYSNRGVTTDGWAAEAGGCSNTARMIYGYVVGENQRARVEAKGDVSGEAFAFGAVADAFSFTSASIFGGGDSVSVGCSALAVLLWVASVDCAEENVTLSGTVNRAGEYEFTGSTHIMTFAGGVVAGTTAQSKVKIDSATVTIEPR